MRPRTKLLAGGALAAVVTGAVLLWWQSGAAMFEPGTVAARIGEKGGTLEPPSQAGMSAEEWRVTNQVVLHHRSVGAGPDLLLLHGGPGYPSLTPWKVTSPLAASFRVHAYDQRGCGRSTRPFQPAPGGSFYSKLKAVESELGLAEQVADIERVRRILGSQRLILVGHSFGALVAALYAAEMPERVQALVLVSPAPLVVMPKEGPDLFELVEARLSDHETRADFRRYRDSLFDFRALLDQDEKTLSRTFARFREFYGLATGHPPTPDMGEVGGFASLATYASLGRRHDWRAAMTRIKASTIVVHGARDLQPESDTRAFAAGIPGARVAVIPDAGHFAHDDTPLELARLVTEAATK